MQEVLAIRADESALQELAAALQDDDSVDPGDVDYERSDVPGQAGEVIILAILILVGKGVAGGSGAFVGQRSAGAIWGKVSRWQARHGSNAEYAVRDPAGGERPVTWNELGALIKEPGDALGLAGDTGVDPPDE